MRRLLIAVTFTVALTGCAKTGATSAVATSSGESAATDQSATSGTALPADLPSWAKIYPGGVVTQSNFMNTQMVGMTGSVTYTTTASMDQVADFYNQTAAVQGFAAGGALPGKAFTQADTRHAFSFTAVATGQGTQVLLVVLERT